MYYEITNTKEKLQIGAFMISDLIFSFYYNPNNSLNKIEHNLFNLYEYKIETKGAFFSEEDCNTLSEHLDGVILCYSKDISRCKIKNMKLFSDFFFKASENEGFKIIR